MRELVIPLAAQRDANSVELLRAWVAEHGLHCAMNFGFFEAQGQREARAWGILLADVIRHIGNAAQEETGVSAEETVSAVAESLRDELAAPSSPARGSFNEAPS